MHQEILAFLKKQQDYASGEELSQALGITRQALWKHIHQLKEAGYDIVAVPHLGYRLNSSPDRLFPFEVTHRLNTKFTGKKVYYFEEVPSTMNIATTLGMEKAVEGTLVVAEAQTEGRGRLGRSWVSPKYKGIYSSLILRPRIPPSQAALLTLIAAVSICEALKEIADLDCRIKWPNDILVKGKKLGGILTELNAETDRVNFVVIGIGLNVNNDKRALMPSATSVREHKEETTSRIALLQELLRKIEENYLFFQREGARDILEKWRQYSVTLGKRIKVSSRKEHIEGEALDIDSDGGLLVRVDSGLTRRIMAGDVVHCR